jgi:dihydrodipicolinate synthase/N-acetylneuraminate lyase
MQTMANSPVEARRLALLDQLFPEGVPPLWCPLLTHYNENGRIDYVRNAAHLRHLAPHVKAFLIPGSTSDGWELNNDEFWELLDFAFDKVQALELDLLIGVLKADSREALETLNQVQNHIREVTKEPDMGKALLKARVRGFAICAPRGKSVSQSEMERGLTPILELGQPIALYQLPQVTENEMSAELVAELANRFPNFILFKDSSGADRLVSSGRAPGGVFTMRGAEGDYVRWLRAAGGPYSGFLLSTANCFAAELDQMISSSNYGNLDLARNLSDRITGAINEVFELVRPMQAGNIYTNANKAIDHFFAHGLRDGSPPRLHSGVCLPPEILQKTKEILLCYAFMPAKGYMSK